MPCRMFVEKREGVGPVKSIEIQMPNGRAKRAVTIFEGQAATLLQVPFESVKFLGDYQAVHFQLGDSASPVIEAGLQAPGPFGFLRVMDLNRIPRINTATADSGERSVASDQESARWFPGPFSPIRVDGEEFAIELSQPSANYITSPRDIDHYRGPVTLKILGTIPPEHDDALALLEDLGNSFLFDLDLRYGIPLELRRREQDRPARHSVASTNPPQYPRNRYDQQALALYRYGQSAANLPLLEFLAYYQVIEFYFPVFTNKRSIQVLRKSLRDPRFDISDDSELARVVNRLHPAGRASMSERDQLFATIEACVDSQTIEDFVRESFERKSHFCNGKQATPTGPKKLDFGKDGGDVRRQLADRIYNIRCRIVHTKQDSSDSGVDLLLPSSFEAQSLWHDIDLLRLVAQQALIVGSARR